MRDEIVALLDSEAIEPTATLQAVNVASLPFVLHHPPGLGIRG